MPVKKDSGNLVPVNKITGLPQDWTEENVLNYEVLSADAKRIFPYLDDAVIHIAVIAHINKELGRGEEADKEDVERLMKKYKDDRIVYETPFDPDFDFQKTMLNMIEEVEVSE